MISIYSVFLSLDLVLVEHHLAALQGFADLGFEFLGNDFVALLNKGGGDGFIFEGFLVDFSHVVVEHL